MNRCVFCNFDKEKEENTILYEKQRIEDKIYFICKKEVINNE